MKGRVRAGLIVISTWSIAFILIAAAASVCSSCGKASASPRVSCGPAR